VIVVSPQGEVVIPVVVTIHIEVEEGFGADLVRAEPEVYKVCYSLDGDSPPTSYYILKSSGELSKNSDEWKGLPVLDDPKLKPGSTHTFESWLQRADELETTTTAAAAAAAGLPAKEPQRLGYRKHTFSVRRKMSAHHARLKQWNADVARLIARNAQPQQGSRGGGPRPRFIEVGTSYFETLAHAHALNSGSVGNHGSTTTDDGWVGTSVEPIAEYLKSLPTRPGLHKVNAMVCPHAGERTIYTLKGIKEVNGRGVFFQISLSRLFF
jgi:hypothetical protein